jgi:hypothetical protein
MPSWGNSENAQFGQPMNSNGETLNVNGNTGGTSYQAEFKDSHTAGNAVKVDGAIYLFRGNLLQARIQPNLVTPTSPVLNINTGTGPTNPADPDIVIGQTGSSPAGGNHTSIGSRLVTLREGGGANDEFPVAINGPVRMLNTTGGNPDVALETEGVVITTGIELPEDEHTMRIGTTTDAGNNATEIRIGIGAGTTNPAEGIGSNVKIKGNVTIEAGTGEGARPGTLIVPSSVTCGGTLTANGAALLNGAVDMASSAQIDGALTVGSAQTPANATIRGTTQIDGALTVGTQQQAANTTINGNLTARDTSVNSLNSKGAVTVGSDLVPANLIVSGTSDLRKAVTVGTAQAVANTTMNGNLTVRDVVANNLSALTGLIVGTVQQSADAALHGKLDVDGNLSTGSNLTVDGNATIDGTLVVTDKINVGTQITISLETLFSLVIRCLGGLYFTTAADLDSFAILKQNGRLEFFTDGVLRFYVDDTGGHNA